MTTEEKSTTILAYMEEEFDKAVNDMSTLGIYRKEFETLLRMYAEVRAQYRLAWEEFVESGCVAECKTNAGGVRKTAALTTMEELRRQIGAYADRLKLAPKSYGMEEQGNGSKLEKILGEVGKLQSGV